MGKHKITQITGEIPKSVKLIPETLSPHFATPTVKIRHTGRDGKKQDKETLLLRCSLCKPRRDHRDKQIKTDKRIHKPEMTCQRREIKQRTREIMSRSGTINLIPQHRNSAIKNNKNKERRENPHRTPAIKLHSRLPLPHRHKKKSRHNHKQRHRHTRKTVIQRHPKTVRLRKKQRLWTRHIGRSGCPIKILRRMHQHHEETREHPDVIKKHDTFHNRN